MSEIAHLAALLFRKAAGGKRLIVAIAGPPGAGKSTFAEALLPLLPEGSAAVVPMDGFHYDNAVLQALGMMERKGAPESFDFDGLRHLLGGQQFVAEHLLARRHEGLGREHLYGIVRY